jgi:hypothetical protein
VLLPVWIALGVSVVVVAGALGFAVVRGFATWRTLRRVRRRTVDGIEEMTRRVDRVEQRLEGANASAARLQRALAELQESLARAGVLSAAVAEVRATVSRFTGIMPRK